MDPVIDKEIQNLIDDNLGDTKRLEFIQKCLQDEQKIYNSDLKYLMKLLQKHSKDEDILKRLDFLNPTKKNTVTTFADNIDDARSVSKKSDKPTSYYSISLGLAFCGIIGIVIYITTFVALDFIEPNYSPFSQYISEHGAIGAPYSFVLNSMLIIVGILTILLSFGLHRGINNGSKIGPLFVMLIGIGLMGNGIFPCGEGCDQESISTNLHFIAGFPALIGSILAPLIISRRLKTDMNWKNFRIFSLICGFIAIPLTVLFLVLGAHEFIGALQRLFLIEQLGWPLVMAIQLFRVSQKSKNTQNIKSD